MSEESQGSYDNEMDVEMTYPNDENEMLGPQDGEEVNVDGDDVDMENLCVMLHHFKGDDKLSKEYKKFNALIDNSKEELYSNCKKEHTKLISTLELLSFKAERGLLNRIFTKMLSIFKEMLPNGNELQECTAIMKK
jgi:hypothetical protein